MRHLDQDRLMNVKPSALKTNRSMPKAQAPEATHSAIPILGSTIKQSRAMRPVPDHHRRRVFSGLVIAPSSLSIFGPVGWVGAAREPPNYQATSSRLQLFEMLPPQTRSPA